MKQRITELRQRRQKALVDMRAIIDSSEAEKRDMTTDEIAKYEAMEGDIEKLDSQVELLERQEKAESRMKEAAPSTLPEKSGGFNEGSRSGETRASKEYHEHFLRYLQSGETRDLIQGKDDQGGYVVPSEKFIAQLIQGVDNLVYVRQRATKLTIVGAKSIGVPTLDTDVSDAEWTSELTTGSADTAFRLGKRAMAVNPLSKQALFSRTLLRNTALPIEDIVTQRLAYKFAVAEENAYFNGSGSGQPLGMFTASDDGIPTSRDVSIGNTQTAITFDGLIEAEETLDEAYWPDAEWFFNRLAVKQLRKIKDGNGQYVWEQSIKAGAPDMLLNHPVRRSKYVPSTFTANQYVGLLGVLKHYWILDNLDMTIQRLVELYALQNKDSIICRKETDGAPVLPEAFVRVKLAA